MFADDPKILEIGQDAPDFKLEGVDNKFYSLEDFSSAEVLTIVFTANHCPTAQAYEERMKKLSADFSPSQMQRMYGQRGFEVVSISVDQLNQQEKVLKFLDEKQAAFPNYIYTERDREEMFELVDPNWQGNIPYTLIVKPGGDVVYRHDGIIEPLEVRKSVIELIGRYFADD